jgi:hypothetical protein
MNLNGMGCWWRSATVQNRLAQFRAPGPLPGVARGRGRRWQGPPSPPSRSRPAASAKASPRPSRSCGCRSPARTPTRSGCWLPNHAGSPSATTTGWPGATHVAFGELLAEKFLALPESAGSLRAHWLATGDRGDASTDRGRPSPTLTRPSPPSSRAAVSSCSLPATPPSTAPRHPGPSPSPGLSPSELAVAWKQPTTVRHPRLRRSHHKLTNRHEPSPRRRRARLGGSPLVLVCG